MTVLPERLAPFSLSGSTPLERLGDSRIRELQLDGNPSTHGVSKRRMPALERRKQRCRNSCTLGKLSLRPTGELAEINELALGLGYVNQLGHLKAQYLRDALKSVHLRCRSSHLPGRYGCRADRRPQSQFSLREALVQSRLKEPRRLKPLQRASTHPGHPNITIHAARPLLCCHKLSLYTVAINRYDKRDRWITFSALAGT